MDKGTCNILRNLFCICVNRECQIADCRSTHKHKCKKAEPRTVNNAKNDDANSL